VWAKNRYVTGRKHTTRAEYQTGPKKAPGRTRKSIAAPFEKISGRLPQQEINQIELVGPWEKKTRYTWRGDGTQEKRIKTTHRQYKQKKN